MDPSRVSIARWLFQLGTLPFIALGLGHAWLARRDISRPQHLAPTDDQVRALMALTPLKLTTQTTVWKAWLGFNLSHSLGLVSFGLVLLLVAAQGFDLVLKLRLLPLAILVALIYLALALRFWFVVPAVGAVIGLILFVGSAVLSFTR